MSVPHRKISANGPDISLFSLGSWHTYDRMDFDEAARMLRHAVDQGINLFDVAVYGRYAQKFPLTNPRLGRTWTDLVFTHAMRMAGVPRSSYMVAEKIWLWAYPRLSIEEQLDHALLRLGSDYADFIMLGDMEDKFDFNVIVAEVGALIAKGKVRWWGVNNWSVHELRAAYDCAVANNQPRPQLAQLKYNVSRRTKPEDRRWLELFEQAGIGLQASDIFESGYLAGKTEVTRGVARDPGDIRPLIQEASPRFTALARDLDATPAQLSIAFCLSHPAIANVLFGCTSQAQLEENLAASALARRHGSEIRKLVEDFWFDRDRIDPESSWSAAPMELSPPVAAR